jgi:hypothetical protein
VHAEVLTELREADHLARGRLRRVELRVQALVLGHEATLILPPRALRLILFGATQRPGQRPGLLPHAHSRKALSAPRMCSGNAEQR